MKVALFYSLPEGEARIPIYEQVKRLKDKHRIDLFTFLEDEGQYDIKPLCEKIYLYPYEAVETKKKGIPRIWEDLRSFTLLRSIHRRIAKDIDGGGYSVALVHQSRLTHAPYLLRFLLTPSIYYCRKPLQTGEEHGFDVADDVRALERGLMYLTKRIQKRIDRTNARFSTMIVTGSQAMAESIRSAYGIEPYICHEEEDSRKNWKWNKHVSCLERLLKKVSHEA